MLKQTNKRTIERTNKQTQCDLKQNSWNVASWAPVLDSSDRGAAFARSDRGAAFAGCVNARATGMETAHIGHPAKCLRHAAS